MTSGSSLGTGGARDKWLTLVGTELALDPEAVFPETSGFFVTRANDRRAKLLGNLKPVLLRALEAGERVRYAARAVRYEVGEFLFSGHLAAVYSNRMALVLTDRRLLMLYVDSSGKPRRSRRARARRLAGPGRSATRPLRVGPLWRRSGVLAHAAARAGAGRRRGRGGRCGRRRTRGRRGAGCPLAAVAAGRPPPAAARRLP